MIDPNDQEEPLSEVNLGSLSPNPARSSASISYTIRTSTTVQLDVYDLLGRRVATLVDGVQTAGTHEVVFDTSGLPSGVYILRLTVGDHIATTKVSVVH